MKLSPSSLLHVLSFSAVTAAFVACSADGDSNVAPPNDTPDSSVTSGDASTPSNDAGTVGDGSPSATCGNKKVDPGEGCDDGNTTSGDGCSATCTVESAGPADVCGGVEVALVKEDASTLYKAHVAGDTTGLFNHYSSACGGGSGSDAVYRFDPPMTGRATVKITAGFPAIASVRTACDDAKTELGCSEGDTLAFPVFAGKPVFVFVDGYGGQNGEFTLDIDVETAICGNGTAEFPETCDDGNTTSGDGCSATCTLEDVASTSACPGMGYRLKPGTASFAGDTSTLATGGGNALGCQFSGAAKNATYAITPTVTGNLALSLLANYPEALLHIRRSCTENATQADCTGAADALVPITTNFPVFEEQTVYVFVDGDASGDPGGLFTLNATLTTASCGNGKVDGGEECDDGGTADGDGCSATCTVERDPATYACPGKALRLEGAAPGPRMLKVRGTTTRASGESLPANKITCGSSSANDVVYAITSDIDGYLTAKVKGDFNTAIAIRSSCAGSDLSCVKTAGGNGQEVLKAAVDKETTYYVFVDGATANTAGTFELELEVTPSVCGNSVIEGGETCDDGALDNGDGCDSVCKLETEKARDVCGDAGPAITLEPVGTTGKYGATLASGTTNLTKPGTASSHVFPTTGCSSTKPDAWFNITAPITGVLTARIDSATFFPTIGLRTDCAPNGTQLTCNGGTTFGGQEIVYPVTQGVTYRFGVAGHNSSVPPVGRFVASFELVPDGCGDTLLNSATEECEDGNTTNGDGCSATCTVETLAGINACPGHALALTGAGAAPRRAVLTVDTAGLPSNTGGACGGSGPEGIVALTSDIDGTLAVTSTAGHAVVLHARTTCANPATELTRSSCTSGGPLSSFSAAIKKNTPYYLFVDGVNGASGVSKLSITVTP